MQQTRLKETDNVCRLTAEQACKTWSSNTESAAQIRLRSLTELQHCYFPSSGPQLVLDWVRVQTRENSINQTREHRNEPEVMLSSLLLLCYFHIWTLHAECSDQSGATLIADGSGAGSSERDTTCVCRCSEFLHIKLEKCVFVHVFISAECVNFTLLCAGTNTDRCVSVSDRWMLRRMFTSNCHSQQNYYRSYWEAVQPGNVPTD